MASPAWVTLPIETAERICCNSFMSIELISRETAIVRLRRNDGSPVGGAARLRHSAAGSETLFDEGVEAERIYFVVHDRSLRRSGEAVG